MQYTVQREAWAFFQPVCFFITAFRVLLSPAAGGGIRTNAVMMSLSLAGMCATVVPL
jgi:hypothetical protein